MAGCGDVSILKSAAMGRDWAKQIGEQLEELKPHQLVPSIFQVPSFFRIWDAKSYTPQLVDLGPFHHFRPQLWETTAAKRRFVEQGRRRRRRLNSPAGANIDDYDLRNFTDQVVAPLLPAIRAQYDSHLDFLDSPLASLLALDSHFLVELLLRGDYDDDDDDERAAYCGSILMNDAVMLENQIPLFLLREAGLFCSQLGRIYLQLSPLQFLGLRTDDNHPRARHLLEYLYFQIVGGCDDVQDQDEDSSASFLHVLEMAPPGLLKKVQSNAAVEFDIFDLIFHSFQAGTKILKNTGMFWLSRFLVGLIRSIKIGMFSEEVLVPAASRLARHLDLTILPADGGTSLGAMVSFDEQKRTLRLPVLTLKPNCGTLLRNLVAYEYMTRTEDARVLIGYLSLICGLTRTEEDMNLLRRAHVIEADGSDETALRLFSSQMPPVSLCVATLDDLAFAEAMAEKKAAAKELDAATKEIEAASMEAKTKLEARATAKEAAASTALDPHIQALVCCYNRKPRVVADNRMLQRCRLALKLGVLVILLLVAYGCVDVIVVEPLCKFVSLDCLYQWPCCPQGLFSALVTLVTGGFILNLFRALL